MALKKHKIVTAKRTEEKKAAIAAQKELAAQPIDVDIHQDSEVWYRFSILFFSYFTSFTG